MRKLFVMRVSSWSAQLARLLCLLYLGTVFTEVQQAYAQPVLRNLLPSVDLRSLEVDRSAWLRQVLQAQTTSQPQPQIQQADTTAHEIDNLATSVSNSSLPALAGSAPVALWNTLSYGSLVRSPAGALLALTPAVLLVQGVVQPNSFNLQHQLHYSQSENYRVYTQLRSDPRFLAQLQNTDLILLNSLDFPALSATEQQRLLAMMRQVIQQPVTGVTRSQEQQALQASTSQGTNTSTDYASQATALASRTLRNMPVLRIQQQLGNDVLGGLQDYAQSTGNKLLGELQLGAINSVAACSGTRYSNVTCTKPVVLESRCVITPELSHTVGKPAPPQWQGSILLDPSTLERSLTLAGGATVRVLRLAFDSLSSATQITRVQVRTSSYLVTLKALGYAPISKDWVDITTAWNPSQQSLELWLEVPTKQRYSAIALTVCVSFKQVVPPQTIKWHEDDCPLAELVSNGFTYLEPDVYQQLAPHALGGDGSTNLPIYTTECTDIPQPIVEGCVEVEGKQICGISNPYNPALQSHKFCKELVITWRYLAAIPDDCEAKLEQATQASQGLITNVTGIVLHQQERQAQVQRSISEGANSAARAHLTQPMGNTGNPHDAYRLEAGNCELASSTPVTRTGNPVTEARDPWSAGFLRNGTRKEHGADLTVTGTVGVTLTYRCFAPATNQTCVDTILSRLEPQSCPLQVRVRDQQVTYPLSEDFTCVMGHNCPDYIQAAPQASWHRQQMGVTATSSARNTSLTSLGSWFTSYSNTNVTSIPLTTQASSGNQHSPSGSAERNSTTTSAPYEVAAHPQDLRITYSPPSFMADSSTASSAEAGGLVPTSVELQRLAQRMIPSMVVATNPQCTVLSYEPSQGLVAYRCTSMASYTNQLVQKVAECDDYQCQLGDPGCNKRVANSQSIAQVISATSILNAIQEDAACDLRQGECQLFAGEARTCRCSINGLVDCCNLPTNVNLNDYLQLTFALTQLTNASFTALGKEARFGTWKNLGDLVGQGFSQGFQALKQPLTSAWEAAFGSGVASSAAGTAGTVASSVGSAVAGSATSIGGEVAVSATSGALEAMRQMIMQSLNDWITETFGQELAAKIFTVEAGKIALNSSLANVFAFANNVYLAYSVGKLLLQIAYRCHEHEYATAGKKKLRSCTLVGIYCSQEVAGVCLQTKTTTCCFSNPLSRILQEQIRRQLRLGFGTPEHPDCRALPSSILSKVDWNQINLDEWVGIMLANENFATLSKRLVEQKVFLTRVDDTTHGELATQLEEQLDTRDTTTRNSQRLEHLSSQLSLERFVAQAKLFLLSE